MPDIYESYNVTKKQTSLVYKEALNIEKIRNGFSVRLDELLKMQGKDMSG